MLFFLALDPGPAFAREAAVGTLLGLAAICGFSVAYLAVSARGPWLALLAAAAGFVLVGLATQPLTGAPFPLLAAGVTAAIALSLRLLPRTVAAGRAHRHPGWDLPTRVAIGTVLVVALTSIAPRLGAARSGLVATFPVYVSVLAVFEHRRAGPRAALGTLRGLLTGLFGTVAFYVAVWDVAGGRGGRLPRGARGHDRGGRGVVAGRPGRRRDPGARGDLTDPRRAARPAPQVVT